MKMATLSTNRAWRSIAVSVEASRTSDKCVAIIRQLCNEGFIVTEQNFETMRRAMVANQLRTTAVNDQRVVAAMTAVERERFVPADRAALAYLDAALPLGEGRALNLPMATGRLLTEASVRQDDRVLLIGAATGYAAALLARLAKSVVALESDSALAAQARANLADAANVEVVEGPLAAGWPSAAPFDLIVVDGAVEAVPQALIDQLVDGGRIACGIAAGSVLRLAIGRKGGAGFGLSAFADADIIALPGFEQPKPFRF